MQVWLGCLRESGLHLPPSGPQFTQSRARGPPGLGLQGPEVAAQLGGSLPHRCSQPANLPPRDYIKQSPPPGCARGVARGRGWRGAGKDGCFPGLVIFPRSRLAGPAEVGRGPGPSPERRAIPEQDGGGESGSANPTQLYFLFFFFTPVSFSLPLPLRSWERSGEGGKGRGGDKRHPGSPGLLGLGSTTPPDNPAVGPQLTGGGGVRVYFRPQFPLLHPF